jgi:hypothetical protein
MFQVVEYLSSKHETLNSTPIPHTHEKKPGTISGNNSSCLQGVLFGMWKEHEFLAKKT